MRNINFSQKIFIILIVSLIIFSYFFGFHVNENAAGGGGYTGDLSAVFNNLQLFINNKFFESIKLTADNNLYYTNRPPLLYILHSWVNPYSSNLELFRLTVFLISFLAPVLFYFCLKIKFRFVNNFYLIFLASLILLSPYFRTSSFWALEENYAIISMLFSYILINFFFFKKTYFYLLFAIFFTSICVYFDQKFILIPLIFLFLLIYSEINIKFKIFSILLFFLLSTPFYYLIKIWGNITPVGNSNSYKVGSIFYFHHICYMANIIGFYLFPFLFLLSKEKILELLTNIYKKKINHLFILISIIYLFCFLFFLDIKPTFSFGGGYSYKAAIFFSKNIIFQKLLLSIFFLFSFLLILVFANENIINSFFFVFYLLSSIFINPLLHEYLDPLILLFFLTFSKTEFSINFKGIFAFFCYFLIILVSANIYY